jgi:hypothetical protein
MTINQGEKHLFSFPTVSLCCARETPLFLKRHLFTLKSLPSGNKKAVEPSSWLRGLPVSGSYSMYPHAHFSFSSLQIKLLWPLLFHLSMEQGPSPPENPSVSVVIYIYSSFQDCNFRNVRSPLHLIYCCSGKLWLGAFGERGGSRIRGELQFLSQVLEEILPLESSFASPNYWDGVFKEVDKKLSC